MQARIHAGAAAMCFLQVAWSAAPSAQQVEILDDSLGHASHYVFAFGDAAARESDVRERARARAGELCGGVFVVIEELLHPKRERGTKDFLIVRCGKARPTNLRYAPLASYSARYALTSDRYTIVVPDDAVTEQSSRTIDMEGRAFDDRGGAQPTLAPKELLGCDCNVTTATPCEAHIASALGRLMITAEPARRCSRVTFSVDGQRHTTNVANGSSVYPWVSQGPPRVEVHECQTCLERGR